MVDVFECHRPSSSRLFNNTELFSHLPLIDMDVEAIGHEIPYWREWLEHDTNDGYWRKLSPLERHTAMRVPTFQQGGWFDPYVESAFRMNGCFRRMAANVRIPSSSGFWLDLGPTRRRRIGSSAT